jgi:Arc/MetJ-type ribon-helix-helix transcriptional regulator
MTDERNSPGDVVIEEKGPENDDILVTNIPNDEPQQKSGFDELASSVKEAAQEVAQKTGEVFNKATESIGKAIDSALSARDHVVMVRVNDDSLRSLDALVQTGIFKSRSEAAAFLISEGVKAQAPLFERISERIREIERLRTELKDIVKPSETETR